MNFRKLITYLTMGTAAAMPLAVAQNPTILQGNYISNVFGNSNFVLNPNAQTNVANVTNATRSTTTPLVATSEFTLSLASGANATWTLRAFDGGMKGQNCEARFTYRGFATATTKAEIVQNSLVVASLTLTPTTDPRIASINFPCGDLVNATTFRIAQTTANMTGTNEIGGIYVGLATNMANVAQAEMVGTVTFNNGSAGKQGITSTWTEFDAGTWTPTVIGQGTGSNRLQIAFSYLPAGRYYVNAIINPVVYGGTTTSHGCRFGIQETTSGTVVAIKDNAATPANIYKTLFAPINGNFDFTTGAARTFRIVVNGDGYSQSASGNCFSEQTGDGAKVQLAVYRFPSSSELVVTPERQNVFGGVKWPGISDFSQTASIVNTTVNTTNFGTPTAFGKAAIASSACGLTTNDVGVCFQNVPPGTYEVTTALETGAIWNFGTAGAALCSVRVEAFGTSLANTYVASALTEVVTSGAEDLSVVSSGTFTVTSFQPTLALAVRMSKASNTGRCLIRSQSTANNYSALPTITMKALDQPSNSALYVQGPVLGAQTGAAIPAGYAGQAIHAIQSTNQTMASGNWAEISGLSITLTPGIWMVQGTGYWSRNGATMTAFEMACGLGSSSGDVSANYAATKFYRIRTAQEVALPSQVSANSLAIRSFYVRSDGTNLYFADGTTFISGSQTIKMACYTGQWTGGPVQASGVIEAVRVN